MSEKWKHSEYILNFIEKDNDDEDLLLTKNFTEDSHKKELTIRLNSNFPIYKKNLHFPLFFYLRELDLNMKEACDCLIIESYTACITLTNHIFEKALKLTLIQNDIGLSSLDYEDWNKLEPVYKKYADQPMGEILSICENNDLINNEEFEELKTYKEKYRDGFSHYSPSKILKNEDQIVLSTYSVKDQKNKVTELSRQKITPDFHNFLLNDLSKKNAENYLKYILKVVSHLEIKLTNKFKTKNIE